MLCSWLFYTYETEYDDYVIEHYSTSNISDERLFDKLKRACKSFLVLRAGHAPCECWPDFYQAVETQNVLHKADAQAPPEPVQSQPREGSTLSVKALVILMDKQSEVFKTSPTTECETVIKHLRTSSRAPQLQLSPHSASTMAVPSPKLLSAMSPLEGSQESSLSQNMAWGISTPSSPAKANSLQPPLYAMTPVVILKVQAEAPSQAEPQQLPIKHVGAPFSLIPSSLAQESNEYKCEHTSCP